MASDEPSSGRAASQTSCLTSRFAAVGTSTTDMDCLAERRGARFVSSSDVPSRVPSVSPPLSTTSLSQERRLRLLVRHLPHRSFTHTRATKVYRNPATGVAATRTHSQTELYGAPHRRCARAAVRRAARAESSGCPRVAHEARRGASKQCHLTRPSHDAHIQTRGARHRRASAPHDAWCDQTRVRRLAPTPCPALSS